MTFSITPEMVFSITSKKEFTQEQMDKFDAKLLKERKKELVRLHCRVTEWNQESVVANLRRIRYNEGCGDRYISCIMALRMLQPVPIYSITQETKNFKYLANVDDAIAYVNNTSIPLGYTVYFPLPDISSKEFSSTIGPKLRTIPDYIDNWICSPFYYVDPKTKNPVYYSASLNRYRS